MSTRKNLNLLFFAGSLLLTLVGCGNDTKSKGQKELNPVCSEIDCLSSVNWKIILPGRSFPEKSRVDINGTTVLNECVSKQKYAIDRTAEPETLYLENYIVPQKENLRIEVLDLGSDCDSESSFIVNEKVNFDINKLTGITEIVISL
jgi:hypothetical protein